MSPLLCELFRVSAKKFTCPQCGREGLTAKPSEPLNEEEWGMARNCSECGIVIPAERLEVFPEATLCAECQRKDERGRAWAHGGVLSPLWRSDGSTASPTEVESRAGRCTAPVAADEDYSASRPKRPKLAAVGEVSRFEHPTP